MKFSVQKMNVILSPKFEMYEWLFKHNQNQQYTTSMYNFNLSFSIGLHRSNLHRQINNSTHSQYLPNWAFVSFYGSLEYIFFPFENNKKKMCLSIKVRWWVLKKNPSIIWHPWHLKCANIKSIFWSLIF